jgi:hypothetical protein
LVIRGTADGTALATVVSYGIRATAVDVYTAPFARFSQHQL